MPHEWMSTEGMFDDSMFAMLSATGDPAIFQLDNFNVDSLLDNPSAPIEVSMGQMNSITPFDFSEVDFLGSQPFNNTIEPSLLFNNPDEYINFDPSPLDSAASRSNSFQHVAPTPMVEQRQSASPTAPTPYVPPAGAAYTSTRRVAASWKPQYAIDDSPIDTSPPRAWGVSAN